MSQTTTPQWAPWQRWAAIRRIIGDSEIEKIFKVGTRTIQRWSADPAMTESSERNPDDRRTTVLLKLLERGRFDIAHTIVAEDAAVIGCRLVCNEYPAPDKASLAEECLDDLPTIAEYHAALLNPDVNQGMVRESMRAAIKELEQNYSTWCKKHGVEV